MLRDSAAPHRKGQFLNPPDQCDLIMQGGITSGVVYPGAVLKLAARYKFRSIGGTSAGAIAAAATAAAEYGRAHGGFDRLNQLPNQLGDRLLSLFQPARPFRGIFGLFVACLGNRSLALKIPDFLWQFFACFPISVLLGLSPTLIYIGRESPSLRTDFLTYCSRERSALSSRAFEALAREMPRSYLLREHCLRSLNDGPENLNASPLDQRRRQLVVGRILGRQFASEATIREQLENCVIRQPSAAIIGLSIGWKDNPILVAEYAGRRDSSGRHLWPDAAHLTSIVGSREDFCQFLSHLLRNSTGSLWDFLPFCIEPIVERIKTEEGLGAVLIQRVFSTNSGSEKSSLPRLLALANYMDQELRQWCEREFSKQSNHSSLPEFGFDVLAGRVRPLAHTILDALSPNQ